jgi:methylenetetrahydrofolate--tRNA-(uracil-5-)-methyltransferase
LTAGLNAVRFARGEPPLAFPLETAIGSLCRYISTPRKDFAPMNINFGLLPPIDVGRRTPKTDKQRLMCERALEAIKWQPA